MAKFNKDEIADVPVVDQTRNSQGFRGNTAIGTLFEGLGTGIKMATEAAYTATKNTIQKEIYDESDRIRGDYGVDAAVDFKTGLDNPSVLPKDIEVAGNRLQMLRSAYMTNKLRESNYWAQLDLMSRQLRYRYPGFREEIDTMISQVTGNNPANAVRSSLAREAEEDLNELRRKNSDENSEDKRRAQLEDYAVKEGIELGGAYYQMKENGNPPPVEWLHKKILGKTAIKATNEAIRDEITTSDATRGDKENRLNDRLRVEAHQRVTALVDNALSPIAGDTQAFKKLISGFREGEKLTGDKLQQANALIGKIRGSVSAEKAKLSKQYAGLIPKDKMDQTLKGMDSWVDNLADDLENQRTGMLVHLQNNVKINQSVAQRDLSENIKGVNDLSAMKEMLGPELANTLISQTGVLSDLQQQVAAYSIQKLTTTNSPISQVLEEAKRNGALNKKSLGVLTKAAMDAAASPQTNEEVTSLLINNLYDESGINIVKNLPQEDKATFVLQMANPTYVMALRKKMDAGVVTQDQWNKYKGWLYDTATVTMRQEVSTANQITNTRKYLNLEYDPKSYTLKAVRVPGAEVPGETFVQRQVSNFTEWALEPTAQRSVNEVNKLLMGVAMVAKAEGRDPNEVVPQMIDRIGIQMNAAKQPNLPDSVWSLMRKAGEDFAKRHKIGQFREVDPRPVTTETMQGIPVGEPSVPLGEDISGGVGLESILSGDDTMKSALEEAVDFYISQNPELALRDKTREELIEQAQAGGGLFTKLAESVSSDFKGKRDAMLKIEERKKQLAMDYFRDQLLGNDTSKSLKAWQEFITKNPNLFSGE